MKSIGILGRTNVGKSTLFNRLIKQDKSIISSIAGTTRDFVSGRMIISDQEIELIDFGGVDFDTQDFLEKKVQEKILNNISRLDLIVFVVDGKSGISSEDERITEIIRKSKKQTILVINKVDGKKQEEQIYDFYSLGFDEIIPVSAITNKNLESLILEISNKLKIKQKKTLKKTEKDLTKIAIIGKQNVGKSSLFNYLYGEQRNIVSDIAGTTRDMIDEEIKLNDKDYLFIDTAGLRRKSKINQFLDRESSYKSIKAINNSDIVLYLLDTNYYATSYNIKLLNYALKKGKAVIMVVNKWDIKPADMTEKKYKEILINDNSAFKNIPFIFISAIKGSGVDKLIEEIINMEEKLSFKISTSSLNRDIKRIIKESNPGMAKILYVTQVSQRPIEFLFFINRKKFFTKRITDHLEKKIREKYKLFGIPIFLKFRERDRS